MVSEQDVFEKIPDPSESFTVTGLTIQYVSVCEREAWFYLKGVDIDRQNKHISRGNYIDENTYSDKQSSDTRIIDGIIAPDILHDGTILEVKPSSSSLQSSKNQLLYYLWYFNRFKDENRDGEVAIPSERKRESVELTDENIKRIESLIYRSWQIWNMDDPPELEKKPICENCAYKDFCWQ